MNKKVYYLSALTVFHALQVSGCFVAAMKCNGFFGVFYFLVGVVSCLFGLALNFFLLIVAVDIFGDMIRMAAVKLARKQVGDEDEDEEEEDDEEEEEIEIVE